MRRRRVAAWLGGAVMALGVLILLVVGGGYLWLRTSLPDTENNVRVDGLGAPVEVLRDPHGVPHIFAATAEDAAFALGYVHAQDRLWQMETMRRLGTGRLSEVAGPRTLDTDRYLRTLGLHHLAEEQLKQAGDPLRRVLGAYADGVNGWLQQHDGALPPEFVALRFAPEPWQAADSVLWGHLMAWRLGSNRHHELLRARLAQRLSPAQIDALWPPQPDDAAATLAIATEPGRGLDLAALQAADPEWRRLPVGASNIWALSGSATATGKPLLANDPHLPFAVPGTWYLARIVTPDGEITGATAPGVPFVILGHNGHIAWGMTTANADVEDVFVELVDPDDPARYRVPGGGSQPFETRSETIRVRDQEDVTALVRATRHGPVISDVIATGVDRPIQRGASALTTPASEPEREEQVLALAASYLRPGDRTSSAIFALNRARDWSSFNAALADFHVTPQNVFFADIAGNIGFVTPGRIPIRKSGRGQVPAAGWTGDADWLGFIPYEELPRAFNPPEGRLINANNKLVPDDYPYFITTDWDTPFRAARIAERLATDDAKDIAAMSELQMDAVSLMARRLLPKMLAGLPADYPLPAAAEPLRTWAGEMDRDRAEPLIFEAWLREFGRALYADELGAEFPSYWGHRALFVDRVLGTMGGGTMGGGTMGGGTVGTEAAEGGAEDGEPGSAWCDDIASAERESCAERLRLSLETALAALEADQGPADGWRWGRLHQAQFRHRLFGGIPVLAGLVNREVPQNGGFFTIDRGANVLGSETRPFASVHGAGYRAVYDLADLSRSRFMIAPGQSGNPLSRHYDDLLERWRDGDSITLSGTAEEIRTAASGRLVLIPANAGIDPNAEGSGP